MAEFGVNECAICLEIMDNSRKLHTTECHHTFHESCFNMLHGNACPCCRAVVSKVKKVEIASIRDEIKNLLVVWKQCKLDSKITLAKGKFDRMSALVL